MTDGGWLVLAMALNFKCSNCRETFARPDNLKRHMATHDPRLTHPCPYCQFITNRTDSLKRHVSTYHENNLDFAPAEVQSIIPVTQTATPALLNSAPSVLAQPISDGKFDRRLQLPHNFVYAGATQSVKVCCSIAYLLLLLHYFSVKLHC